MCACGYVHSYHTVPVLTGQRYEILWSWTYRCLWATQWGCWVPDASPLQEQYVLLTAKSSLQCPHLHPPFWGRVSVCIPTRLRFMAIFFSQPTKYWDCKYVLHTQPAVQTGYIYLDADLEKSFISAQWCVIEGDISDGFLLNLLGHLTFVISDKGNWFKGTGGLGETEQKQALL